jgi:hypothetical protein
MQVIIKDNSNKEGPGENRAFCYFSTGINRFGFGMLKKTPVSPWLFLF